MSPAHLAELDLHEDMVLPPTASLCTPGILGPVGARAAGRGPPGAREANSCPGKRDRGQADSRKSPSLAPSPHSPPLNLGQEIFSWEVDGAREEELRTKLKVTSCRRSGLDPSPGPTSWVGEPRCHSCHLHSFLLTGGLGGGQSLGPHRGARRGRPHAAPHDCWALGSGRAPGAGPCCPVAVRSVHPAR